MSLLGSRPLSARELPDSTLPPEQLDFDRHLASSFPSREEFNNHRLTQLEQSFLLSQRTSLIEAKLSHQQQCNFTLELPNITQAEYRALPMRGMVQSLKLASAAVPGSQEDFCHCGLKPAVQIILAAGPNNGRRFLRCIQKEEQQCSFFQWILTKVIHFSVCF